MKKTISVIIKTKSGEQQLECMPGRILGDLLSTNGISFSKPCGGRGTCGKCLVQFAMGAPSPINSDIRMIDKERIDQGWRLACRAVLTQDCVVIIPEVEELTISLAEDAASDTVHRTGASAEVSWRLRKVKDPVSDALRQRGLEKNQREHHIRFGIGIDLGTTTIGGCLVSITEGGRYSIIRQRGVTNRQVCYGADVISRISAASEAEKAIAMRRLVQEDLWHLICQLLGQKGDGFDNIVGGFMADTSGEDLTICLAGNTTMLHLLRGMDVSGLGVAPYQPVSLDIEHISLRDLCEDVVTDASASPKSLVTEEESVCIPIDARVASISGQIKTTIMPGISAFVGGDIVAGLYCMGKSLARAKERYLFLDLGTNGEIALKDQDRFYVTSTAAGPVFEGCGIRDGVPGVRGAISHVRQASDGSMVVETIGCEPPIGICGSGVVDAIAYLVEHHLIDANGLFVNEEHFEHGFVLGRTRDGRDIALTQSDIRAFQLAKAAIKTGVEQLLEHAHVTGKIDLIIAGGFGSAVTPSSLRACGMIPDMIGNISALGNTSLKGCLSYLQSQDQAEDEVVQQIKKNSAEVVLAAQQNFDTQYLESMTFCS